MSQLIPSILAASASNHCQASISIDALLSALVGAAFVWRQGGTVAGLAYVATAPLVSPAVALAIFAARAEAEVRHGSGKMQ